MQNNTACETSRFSSDVDHEKKNISSHHDSCCQTSDRNTESSIHQIDSPSGHSHHAHFGQVSLPSSSFRLATLATLHCLTGCAIGELAGLTIGVSLGLNPWTTMALATVLGFVSGYTLGLWPLVREGKSWLGAFKVIWLGETISIAVMELVMNITDYHVGGVQVSSIFNSQFWLGYLFALPAGFIAAWPVNYWLLKRNYKQPCH